MSAQVSPQPSASKLPMPWICHGAAIFLVFLAGALYPFFRSDGVNVSAGLIIVLYAAAATQGGRRRLTALGDRLRASDSLLNLLLLVTTAVVLVGGLEIVGQVLTRTGWVKAHPGMTTLLPQGVADFRQFHITADKYRIPDPLLLWRPVDHWPYNSQHMKGTVAELPKPPRVFRIICYGDSNTDGPLENTWPEVLERLLNERLASDVLRFEVLNAGVAGYSSYQGLLRFRQQVDTFSPDLIFVSFGWNDAAPAVGLPDRLFTAPGPVKVAVERLMIRYRFYRVARKLLRPKGPKKVDTDVDPRVPLDDFVANLQAIDDLGSDQGIGVIHLTRPFSVPSEDMLKATGDMRSRVPHYNATLRRLHEEQRLRMIDVHRHFAFEGNGPLFTDDAHFSAAGVDRMAELLYERLVEAGLPERSATD